MVPPGCPSAATIADVLQQRGRDESAKLAFTFLVDGASQEASWTYGVLDRQARAIAATLQGEGLHAERALLLYPPGLSFISALFGCFYAGVTAVPSDLPRPRRPMTRLESIAKDCRPAVILTTAELLPELQRRLEDRPFVHGIRLIATDQLPGAAATEPSESSPDQVAVIQYTSGSTSQPKGVSLSHANLLASSTQIAQAFDHEVTGSGVFWLPTYHDMGLIGGVLQPIFFGRPLVFMSPIHVLQQPVRWLQAISRYRATTSGGPNFMYDRCVDSIPDEQLESLDLRSWEVAFNGAEPIQPRTLRRFAERFGRCGFRSEAFFPCYGLAEATLLVSGGPKLAGPVIQCFDKRALERRSTALPPGDDAPVTELVGSGIAGPGVEIRIVDPETCQVREAGTVGEIWVNGPNVATGYWNRPEQTAEVFQASLGDGRRYLRTGDLGFVWRGQLFVTGRCKDLVIIDGRNHYPQDIEQTVGECHPALRGLSGVAFALPADDSEHLAVVHELQRNGRGVSADEVIHAIRQSISTEHEVSVGRVALVKLGEVPRTSSGKVQRSRCRELLTGHGIAVIAEWRADTTRPSQAAAGGVDGAGIPVGGATPGHSGRHSAEDVQGWLVRELERRCAPLGQGIDIRAPFAAFGLTSRDAVELSGQLETLLGRRLSPTLLYEHPTIESLSRALARRPSPASVAAAVHTKASERHEPIAIVGVGCRLPGASGPDGFWRLLVEGRDAIREVPPDRWDPETTRYRSLVDGHDPDGTCLRWGGFLDAIDRFDAKFFGIAPREAMYIDPQQRLLLESAWEALEDAGQTLESLQGSRTGVFVGISTNDYVQLCLQQAGALEPYWSTGNAGCIAANRLSYCLDLKGPSLAVDTACSSSLVAAHLACNSLRNGECDLALAGGVNVILTPVVSTSFAQAGGLAPDGRCKAFDARADGIVRSEGVGVVVLKRLSRALADRDQIYAVIRGSAVNQDGRSNGITAPLQASQEAVLREAYRNAGASPGEVQYIEAHGAGSALGDVIEANALKNVLSEGRAPGDKCVVGSVKTNIGHLEAAAGVAGLIKVALALKHGQLPGNLHFVEPNPRIPLDEMPFTIQTRCGPWPPRHGRRVAGISGFGFGGTNAHLVLECAPDGAGGAAGASMNGDRDAPESSGMESHRQAAAAPAPSAYLLPLSAASPPALQSAAANLVEALSGERGAGLAFTDVCHAAAVRRTHHRARAAICFRTHGELVERLGALYRGERCAHVATGIAASETPAKLAFVFSGHGGQRWNMGRALYQQNRIFRDRVTECDDLLRGVADWSIREELLADESRSRLSGTDLEHLEINQATQFAVQVALADVWREWGIQPDAVIGHSFGEAAAAGVAGALDLSEALRVVVWRSRLMSQAARHAPADGGMAAVRVSAGDAAAFLRGYEDRVFVSAYNSPKYTVLSGDMGALEEVIHALKRQKIGGKLMRAPGAGHTPELEPVRLQLEELLSGLRPGSGSVAFYSTVAGGRISGSELGAQYWGKNLVQTVNFASAIEQLGQDGFDTFVELGPAPLLVAAVNQCLSHWGRAGLAVPSLRPQEDDLETLYRSLGALYATGRRVKWQEIYPSSRRWVSLPGYPWQRESYWLAPPEGNVAALASSGAIGRPSTGHPLLAAGVELADLPGARLWQSRVDLRGLSFLNDYRIDDTVSLPAAVYVEAALRAARDSLGDGLWMLEGLSLPSARQATAAADRLVQVTWTPTGEDEGRIQFHGRADREQPWRLDATCECRRVRTAEPREGDRESAVLDAARERCARRVDPGQLYDWLAATGNVIGPAFRGVQEIWHGHREAVGRLRLPDSSHRRGDEFVIHPVLVEACLHLAAVARGDAGQWLCVPTCVESIRTWGAPPADAELWGHVAVRATPAADEPAVADMVVWDDRGHRVLELIGVRVERLRCADISAAMQDPREWLYEVQWHPAPLLPRQAAGGSLPAGTWVLLADAEGIAAALERVLAARGQQCIVVTPGAAYRACGAHRFELDPRHPDGFRRLFEEIDGLGLPPVRGVAQLWGCRIAAAETSQHTLEVAEDLLMVATLHLVQAVARTGFATAPRLWLVSKRAQLTPRDRWCVSTEQAPLWGLGRTVQREHPSWRCTLVDVSGADAREAEMLGDELLAGDGEDQVVLRGDTRYVARLARPSADHALLSPRRWAGEEMSFALHAEARASGPAVVLEAASGRAPDPREIEIEVEAANVAASEICRVRERAGGPRAATLLGCAGAGRVLRVGAEVSEFSAGDEVLAVGPRSAASRLTITADRVVRRPSALSPEAAVATFPGLVVAWHGLERLGRLAPGERVLIHGACTSVGMAALQIGRRARARMLVTGADPRTVARLRDEGDVCCLDGGAAGVTEQVLAATNGEGVDLVLDCRADGSERVSTRCLRPFGRLVEIVGHGRRPHGYLAAPDIARNVAYFAVAPEGLFVHRPGYCRSLLRELAGLLDAAELAPLPFDAVPVGQVADALPRLGEIAANGDLVLTLRDRDAIVTAGDTPPRFAADATYLIAGGLGGLGLYLAGWLLDCGARHLVLMSRRTPDREIADRLEGFRATGAEVYHSQADVTKRGDVERTLEHIAECMPPLRGVLHCASTLDDAPLALMQAEQLKAVMAPKTHGAWNLHALTLASPLEFFVMFSSGAALLGPPGSANYAAGNAFLDALAEYRRHHGLKALAVGWGLWGDAGMVAGSDQRTRIKLSGFRTMPAAAGARMLGRLLQTDVGRVAVMPVDWAQLRRAARATTSTPFLEGVFAEVADETDADLPAAGMADTLRSAEPARREELLLGYLRQRLSVILGTPPEEVPWDRPLSYLGVDSLLALELKNRVEAELQVSIRIVEVLEGPTLQTLARSLLKQIGDSVAGAEERAAPAPDGMAVAARVGTGRSAEAVLDRIDELKDGDLDALYKQMLAEESGRQ